MEKRGLTGVFERAVRAGPDSRPVVAKGACCVGFVVGFDRLQGIRFRRRRLLHQQIAREEQAQVRFRCLPTETDLLRVITPGYQIEGLTIDNQK
jgi:hypothetical protein